MVSKKKCFRSTKISLVKQGISLILAYPKSKIYFDKNRFTWLALIKPTPLSNEYNVVIKYSLKGSPEVWVKGDNLEKIDAIDFPHIYETDKERNMVKICLYLPGLDWNKSKYISNTIVPWTVEWLYFYEVWLATGKWCGGGIHPRLDRAKS